MEDVARVGGWIQDPKNEKDIPFSRMDFGGLKDGVTSTHIIQEFTPISNQGQLGSCVGNATMDAFEILMGLENPNSVVQLSRLHAYYLGRLYTLDTDKDDGTFIRAVFYQISKLGVCPEKMWPYSDDKSKPDSPVFISPPLDALMTAHSNKISSYYRITAEGQMRLNEIELAVRTNHPVVFGTVVGTNFLRCRDSSVLGIPSDEKGRHAIICTGVRYGLNNKREFLIRNSWGAGWGVQGHAWLSEEYMMWDETRDLWVPTKMPKLVL